jgi:hypothetical protein
VTPSVIFSPDSEGIKNIQIDKILRTILTKRRFFRKNFAIEICLEQLPQL